MNALPEDIIHAVEHLNMPNDGVIRSLMALRQLPMNISDLFPID
ncbi:hypothetical protein V2A85_10615 [Yersinia sp. 1252 StPb PI]